MGLSIHRLSIRALGKWAALFGGPLRGPAVESEIEWELGNVQGIRPKLVHAKSFGMAGSG